MMGFFNYVTGQSQDRPNGLPEDFREKMTENDRTDAIRASNMTGKTRNVFNLLQQDAADETRKKKVRMMNKDALGAGAGNTVVEYEPVMNQMLLQYENAGMNGPKNDRDSLLYRRLRNAALEAHIQRTISRLKKQA